MWRMSSNDAGRYSGNSAPPGQPPAASAAGISRFIPSMPTSVDKGASPATGSLPVQQAPSADVPAERQDALASSNRREARRGQSSKVLGVVMMICAFIVGVLLTSLIVPMIVKML